MSRLLVFAPLLLLAACGERQAGTVAVAGGPGAAVGGALASAAATLGEIHRQRCTACHIADREHPARTPLVKIPLGAAAAAWTGASLETFLRVHHGGEHAPALAAFVRSLADGQGDGATVAAVTDAAFARGERLWRELACTACHDDDGIAGLAARTDHAQVARFLRDPAVRRPDLVHDFRLDGGEVSALAAWLLRAQRRDGEPGAARGLAFECFEMEIGSESLPDLDGRAPAATGTCAAPTVDVRTREDHFALRFVGYVIAPEDGEYAFAIGSDDSSWLWIDDQLVVANAHLSPHRRREGSVTLSAGAHALRVVYTEAAGEQSLEVLWRGPGFALQPLGGDALTTEPARLEPSRARVEDGPHAHVGGGVWFGAVGCTACHDASGSGLAEPLPVGWPPRGDGECPSAPRGRELAESSMQVAIADQRQAAVQLAAALHRDGCTSCHARDGVGGIAVARRAHLAEIEDLGDEGRLPPDLTHVGRRLRGPWLERVLRDGHSVRPYLRVRMPRLGAERAREYAALFAAVDLHAGEGDTEADAEAEPPFSTEAVARGREIVGSGGRNCVTCHPFDGRAATGPQGMDLAIQHERLRPAWFREWLLHPNTLRPGTRMPVFWDGGGDADRAEVDAIRCWASLGAAAPVPRGLRSTEGLVLDPIDGPRLHGAFLEKLSARCLAVGSPERVHYAYDLAHARLAWLWRGAFLDADGTWSGRAGKLLRPLGTDWIVLDDLDLRDAAAAAPTSPAADGDGAPGRVGASAVAQRRLLGTRIDEAGYPVFRLRVGSAVLEDAPRARLHAGGSELVRTLRCVTGAVHVAAEAQSGGANVAIDGAPPVPRTLTAGQRMELVYRW